MYGSARSLPLFSHVKASIGRIASLIFGIPRCQSMDDRTITSPALMHARIAGFPEKAYCQYLYSREWVPGVISIVSQSGGLFDGLARRLRQMGAGLSKFAAVGSEADLTLLDGQPGHVFIAEYNAPAGVWLFEAMNLHVNLFVPHQGSWADLAVQ